MLLDELVHDGEVWPVIARVLASEPAAPALAVAHLAGAGRESRLAFARRLSDEAPRVEVVEEYRDLLEGLYLSGEDGRPAAGPALEALPISDRLFAHQMEQVLGFGASPYLLSDVIFERFGAVSAQLEAAFAGSPERRERSVAVVHCLLDWIVRRPPHEAPELERELRDRGRRWAVRPEPEVALAGGLLALATGEAVDLPRLLDEALAAEAERPAKQAILRRLRFEPDSLDEPAVAALLDVVHCRDCKHDRPLVGAIRAALGGEDFAQAHEDYTSLPLDEPLPGRVFAALTAEYPRFAAGELAAFLDDPRLRALPPSFSLARLLDGVHRFAADRPEVQRTVRDLFAAVFTPEAIRKGEAPEGAPGGVWKAHTNPRHGHWLGALEPAAVHGLMDEVPDDVVAAVEVPPDDAFVRRARAGWGLARFIETSGRRAPEHLREWSRSMWLDTPWSSHGPPEPPGLPGLLQRLDRMDAHRRWRWLAELDADSREVEAALLTRLDHPSAGTRAEARVLLAEMGSARGREVVLRELEASLATGEAPPAHLLAAAVLHGDDLPAAALDRAATAEPTFRNWPLDGLTPLAMDRLARHLRSRAWEETDARATGAVRLLAALRDELTSHFLVELAAHHRSPPVAAAARAARASSF